MAIRRFYGPMTAALQLATRAGEGDRFQKRFAMERQLDQQVLAEREFEESRASRAGALTLAARRQTSDEQAQAFSQGLAEQAQRIQQATAASNLAAQRERMAADAIMNREELDLRKFEVDSRLAQAESAASVAQEKLAIEKKAQERADRLADNTLAREERLAASEQKRLDRGLSMEDLNRAANQATNLVKILQENGAPAEEIALQQSRASAITAQMFDRANAERVAAQQQAETTAKMEKIAVSIVDRAYSMDEGNMKDKWEAVRTGLQASGLLGIDAPFEVRKRVVSGLDNIGNLSPQMYEQWFNIAITQMGFGSPK